MHKVYDGFDFVLSYIDYLCHLECEDLHFVVPLFHWFYGYSDNLEVHDTHAVYYTSVKIAFWLWLICLIKPLLNNDQFTEVVMNYVRVICIVFHCNLNLAYQFVSSSFLNTVKYIFDFYYHYRFSFYLTDLISFHYFSVVEFNLVEL